MSKYLTRDTILKSPVKTAEVDAFGGTVLVCEMPAALVQEFFIGGLKSTPVKDGKQTMTIDYSGLDFTKIAQQVMIDEDGNTLLEISDVKVLAKKSFGDISRIVEKAMEISGFAEEKTLPKA